MIGEEPQKVTTTVGDKFWTAFWTSFFTFLSTVAVTWMGYALTQNDRETVKATVVDTNAKVDIAAKSAKTAEEVAVVVAEKTDVQSKMLNSKLEEVKEAVLKTELRTQP